ncbi:arginine deiminase family protein [Deminuibacter soli]|uniref:arginine deiminase n=1 Tax=Deminuibacter soli TaxID=2291815 RepID=A0A3E1NF39_9BACT|nr:arginine deiminase family protein [Deminuibacter soli]RFM26482.1 amidinotransferase [Deminuibacter soli]
MSTIDHQQLFVESELGTLRKILIHSPDGGIGKIIPSTFSDNLYDDIVHLKKMQKEYNHYVKLLLYFLDPGKIAYINECQQSPDEEVRANCFIPGKKEYFQSHNVMDAQNLLEEILQDERVKLRLIAAICSYEETSLITQQKLESITDTALLSKILITGVLPSEENGTRDDQFIFPPIPNFIFTRDIGIMIKDHILLSRMATAARKRESLITKCLALYYFFKENLDKVIEITEESDFFLYEEEERRQRIISIEGGDIMMIHPKHLIVGCSERTSSNAVNEIIHSIFSKSSLGIEKISVVKIPRKRAQMHIDTIFTQVKRNVWVLYGRYSEKILEAENNIKKAYLGILMHKSQLHKMEDPEILQFYKKSSEVYQSNKDYSVSNNPAGIEALLTQISVEDYGCSPQEVTIIYSGGNDFPHDDREQWTDSCNVVALKEGVVIGYDRNDKTSDAFRKAGFNVLTTEQAFELFEQGQDPQLLENTLILLPSAELSRARGGSHCMSMPLLRDKLV